MIRRRDTILLTGFGPFPGVADNASQRLVPKLAHLAARRFSAHRVVSRILPTEWERAPARLEDLYKRERPKLVLHFGVSAHADAYVIETLARNRRKLVEDAAGKLPSDDVVLAGGPEEIAVRIPAEDVKRRLHGINVPAITSRDAGSYLCNAILYLSLIRAEQTGTPDAVGFLHIPREIPPAELASHTAPGTMRFDWGTALIGGLEIIRTCLGRPPPSRRRIKNG